MPTPDEDRQSFYEALDKLRTAKGKLQECRNAQTEALRRSDPDKYQALEEEQPGLEVRAAQLAAQASEALEAFTAHAGRHQTVFHRTAADVLYSAINSFEMQEEQREILDNDPPAQPAAIFRANPVSASIDVGAAGLNLSGRGGRLARIRGARGAMREEGFYWSNPEFSTTRSPKEYVEMAGEKTLAEILADPEVREIEADLDRQIAARDAELTFRRADRAFRDTVTAAIGSGSMSAADLLTQHYVHWTKTCLP
jgi:hypothetical protein